jgi:hypothetical protein
MTMRTRKETLNYHISDAEFRKEILWSNFLFQNISSVMYSKDIRDYEQEETRSCHEKLKPIMSIMKLNANPTKLLHIGTRNVKPYT